MDRLLISLMVLILPFVSVHGAAAQTPAAAQAAAIAAYELSRMEASGDFNALYDRIHPDAHAVIPRAAAVGWFENEFAPRGPGVSRITGVEFGPWTWAVTGKTYPNTATVSFEQPFADGSVANDVVRLVQDENGEWRWFFGRSREFVDEQIALYVTAQPPVDAGGRPVDHASADLNAFWQVAFSAAGRAYLPPGVVRLDGPRESACGVFTPERNPALYCRLDGSIYYADWFFADLETQFGNFAWVTVLAHEWGHHVQNSLGIAPGQNNAFELQADCLAGAYARDAATRELLDPGDLTEAVKTSAEHGDDPLWPQDRPGAHGTNDDRITAFMRGYLDGFIGCELPIATASRSFQSESAAGGEASLAELLPEVSALPGDLVTVWDASRALPEVAANYTDPAETERRFMAWGWEENVIRAFEVAGEAEPGALDAVYVSLHRFGSPEAAAAALDYSVEDQVASTGALEILGGPLGEHSRSLSTRREDGNEVTIYAQQGPILVRLTATASEGDPLASASGIVAGILGGIGV